MRFEEMKKGLWGYQKESVYQYIAQLEQEARAKRDEEVRRAREESADRIQVLEEALRVVREENESLRGEQAQVAEALIQAQKYAQRIRERADEFEREANARVEARVDRRLQELEDYSAAADALKERLHALLKETLGKTEDIQRELNILHDKGPDSKLVDISAHLETGMG